MTQSHHAHQARPSWVRWVVLGGIALLLIWSGWLVVRGLIARDQLTAAAPAARELAAVVVEGEAEATAPLAAELKDRADTAWEMTHDPVWRASEYVPWVGPNLAAVRQITEVARTITGEGIDPLLAAATEFDAEAFAVVDGRVDLGPIIAVRGDIDLANAAMTSAREQAAAIDIDATVGPVRDAVDQMLALVGDATSSVDALDRTAHLLPAMLGQGGSRNTLVLIQNNAELRASGGVSGALALLTASDGKIDLAGQASTRDFDPPFDEPVVPLDQPTESLYGAITGEYIQNVNLTPWFDTTGELSKMMWERRFGGTIDAVVAVDPVLLSYLLEAAGPVEVGDVTLSSDNAVDVLLSETYARFAEPADQDAFFASAAQTVFAAVTGGDVEPRALVEALVRGGEERRIRIWNARAEEQRLVEGTTLSGILPADNSQGPGIGVYFNDDTGAKMDYYLDADVKVGSGVCRGDGRPTYRVSVTLTSTAPMDGATSLPDYVTGGGRYGVEPGRIKTFVNVYGPVGSATQGVTYPGSADQLNGQVAIDRGRPAVVVPTELAPGETITLVYDFLGQTRERGALTLDVTPTLNVTETQHRSLNC
ncbi:DUF4012 domain-containing protein [Protaetiibacter sp. SSC-01]|uniref:DUF4012 domain-containing protein n=1 Tax=Protaetiibacter sp. SSC-01 TaxID=2759943 RepID=UPI001656FBB6|nr:DUF4012 domain-containing protein [Protaetiibacter sp. SSC-01]QNO38098.1 DUF4012 domain-containing protein [Protaetiibacter sp. SSC-01]